MRRTVAVGYPGKAVCRQSFAENDTFSQTVPSPPCSFVPYARIFDRTKEARFQCTMQSVILHFERRGQCSLCYFKVETRSIHQRELGRGIFASIAYKARGNRI